MTLTNRTKTLLNHYWPFIAVFLTTAFLHFYKLGYAFELNGTDEGIDLMAARLSHQGFHLYTDINAVQAPLMLFVYQLLGSNLYLCRALSALSMLSGLLGVFLIGHRIGNRTIAFLAGFFLSFNYYYLKEGRLASLDLFASVMMIWAFYFLFLVVPTNKHLNRNLMFSGVFFACASMTKLYSAIPLLAVSIYLALNWVSRFKRANENQFQRVIALFIFATTILVLTALLMSLCGFKDTFQGILLNQLQRPTQPYGQKISIALMFVRTLLIPLLFAFFTISKTFKRRETQVLILWFLPLCGLFLFQSLTWRHHYTLIVPPVCLLGAMGIYEYFITPWNGVSFKERFRIKRRFRSRHPLLTSKCFRLLLPASVFVDKTRAVVYIAVGLFLTTMIVTSFARVLPVKRPVAYDVAEELSRVTERDAFVISGDPTIPLYADRNQAPNATNLAKVKMPDLTTRDLIRITDEWDVKAVVFTYNLSNDSGYIEYVRQKFAFHIAFNRNGTRSCTEGDIAILEDTFVIYLRPQSSTYDNRSSRFVTRQRVL